MITISGFFFGGGGLMECLRGLAPSPLHQLPPICSAGEWKIQLERDVRSCKERKG